jgi:hypothetical protein
VTAAVQTYGRWTVIRAAAPEQRRPSSPAKRARALVVCVCGYRKIVWQDDLHEGRSTGCESRRCMVRYQVVDELMPELSKWMMSPEGQKLASELKGRLDQWLVTARKQDKDEGWQVNAGRSRQLEEDESDEMEPSDGAH